MQEAARPPHLLAGKFAETLKGVRAQCGLTQQQLATASGLHRTEISLLETGKRVPLLETMVALCNGLGVTLEQLLADFEV